MLFPQTKGQNWGSLVAFGSFYATYPYFSLVPCSSAVDSKLSLSNRRAWHLSHRRVNELTRVFISSNMASSFFSSVLHISLLPSLPPLYFLFYTTHTPPHTYAHATRIRFFSIKLMPQTRHA